MERTTDSHGEVVLISQADGSAANGDEVANDDENDDDDLDDIEAELLLSQMASRAFGPVKKSTQESKKSFEKASLATPDVKQLCLTALSKVGPLTY